MGLFRKKADPITERARHLDEQIKALEAEIHKLNTQQAKETANGSPFSAPATPPPTAAPAGPASPVAPALVPRPAVPPAPAAHPPRLRSTAFPHSQAVPSSPAPAAMPQEPIFEEDQERLQVAPEPTTPAHYNQLGVRKYDLNSAWQRLKSQVRGPVTSNPKLVHYLSAGSIQGLRPLRYEKRVARNRVIVLAAVLVLVLWGVIAIVIGHR